MYYIQWYKKINRTEGQWVEHDRYAFNRAGYKSTCRRFGELLATHGEYWEYRAMLQIGAGSPVVICANSTRGFEVTE